MQHLDVVLLHAPGLKDIQLLNYCRIDGLIELLPSQNPHCTVVVHNVDRTSSVAASGPADVFLQYLKQTEDAA